MPNWFGRSNPAAAISRDEGWPLHEVVSLFTDEAESERGNSARALEGLRDHMQAADYSPGARLPPERQLAAAIGVGRGALRRALEVLEAEGAITRIQGSGTFFGRPSRAMSALDRIGAATNALEVIEARIELEPVLARLAAERAGEAEIAAMRHTTIRLAAANDSDSRELWDGALHRSIAEAAGNRLLLALFEAIDRVRQNEDWRDLRNRARTPDSLHADTEGHERLIEAIARRDGPASEAAMRFHLEEVSSRLRSAMTNDAASRGRADGALR